MIKQEYQGPDVRRRSLMASFNPKKDRMTPEAKTRKIVFKALDQIVDSAKSAVKEFGATQLPLITLKVILDKSKPSEDTGNKVVDDHNRKYNACLSTLYEECEKWAIALGFKGIPVWVLVKGINTIKSAYL